MYRLEVKEFDAQTIAEPIKHSALYKNALGQGK